MSGNAEGGELELYIEKFSELTVQQVTELSSAEAKRYLLAAIKWRGDQQQQQVEARRPVANFGAAKFAESPRKLGPSPRLIFLPPSTCRGARVLGCTRRHCSPALSRTHMPPSKTMPRVSRHTEI